MSYLFLVYLIGILLSKNFSKLLIGNSLFSLALSAGCTLKDRLKDLDWQKHYVNELTITGPNVLNCYFIKKNLTFWNELQIQFRFSFLFLCLHSIPHDILVILLLGKYQTDMDTFVSLTFRNLYYLYQRLAKPI